MGGFFGGLAVLIGLDVVLQRAPAKFAGNVLGPATQWLADWVNPDVPLIRGTVPAGHPAVKLPGGIKIQPNPWNPFSWLPSPTQFPFLPV